MLIPEEFIHDVIHYGNLVFSLELDICIHQKVYEYENHFYSLVMKSGVIMTSCEVKM